MAYKQPLDQIGDGFPLTGNRFFAAANGNGTVYAATIAGVSGYTDGLQIQVQFLLANIGAVSLNINGFGLTAIKKGDGVDLVAGDITSSEIFALIYYGGAFQLVGKFYSDAFALPASGTNGGSLIWDGTAWVAGGVTTIPSGVAPGDTLIWNGTQWVSQKISNYITEWVSAQWAYDTIGNGNYFYIPISYYKPQTVLYFSLFDLQAYGIPTPSETVFELPLASNGYQILIFGISANPSSRHITIKSQGSVMRVWNQATAVSTIVFPTTITRFTFRALGVSTGAGPFETHWHITYFSN